MSGLLSFVEHAELNFSEICYLAAGDSEKAMRAIEIQLSHNHLHFWDVIHQHPLYNQIRHEPRYIAALAERERRITQQREEIVFLETPAGR